MRCIMRKTIVALLTGVMASALLMSGCQASKGLENDDIKITQYKGVEIDEVEKASEITDDDVDAYIQSMQESKAEVTEITDRAVAVSYTHLYPYISVLSKPLNSSFLLTIDHHFIFSVRVSKHLIEHFFLCQKNLL